MNIPEFDILSRDYVNKPEEQYESWLQLGTAWETRFRVLCVVRHSDVRRVYADPESFASEGMRTLFEKVNQSKTGPLGQPLVSLDGAAHSRLRDIIRPLFPTYKSEAAVTELRGRAEQTVTSLVGRAGIEATHDLVAPFVFGTLLKLLGVEFSVPLDDLIAWSESVRAPLPLLASAERERALAAQAGAVGFLKRCLQQESTPRTAAVFLIRDAVANERCTTEEALSLCRFLFYAGNQTTRLAMASALLMLARSPVLVETLQKTPSLTRAFLQEAIRLEPPTQVSIRTATCDTSIAGVPIAQGSFLFTHNGCANRDPTVFERPDEVDLNRPNRSAQLAFGYGLHSCLGMDLALLEMEAVVGALLARAKRLELAEPDGCVYQPRMFLRGPERLELRVEWE